jgi:hypothetical protein
VPRYKARIRLDAYVDVTVEADDEETARDFALTEGYETPFPEVSDIEVEWIEEERVGAA